MDKINKNYIGLTKELALTYFKLKYQGSVLGYFWSLVKPLMLFLVLLFVFTRIFKLGGSIEHYPVYLLLGIVVWGFFAEITAISLGAIVENGDLIRKVYFPRIVLVIARSITSLMVFALNLLVVLAFMFFEKIVPGIDSVLILGLTLELFVLATGVGLILSSLFVRYRDIAHIWEVFLTAAFYATPILYPLSLAPERFAGFLMLNPMAQIIQDMRYLLITKQAATAASTLPPNLVWIPYTLPLLIFAFGYWLFNRSSAKFAEEV